MNSVQNSATYNLVMLLRGSSITLYLNTKITVDELVRTCAPAMLEN